MNEADPGKAKAAQESSKYSASDANKQNQKQNAEPTGKKAHEGKDPMGGKNSADSIKKDI